MWSRADLGDLAKADLYRELAAQLRALLADEADLIANLANTAALLFHTLPTLNWCGFYLLREGELVVGPFQGRPACVRISLGKGVCGRAALTRAIVRVEDVSKFAGHITCDPASRAEFVLPLLWSDDSLLGVLDLDSPAVDHFDLEDEKGLASLVTILSGHLQRHASAISPQD